VKQSRTKEDPVHRRSLALAAALAVAASLVASAGAQARGGDRNHDRIPDRWERTHHLSVKVDQRKRDQDRDGLKNLAEYRAGMNPRDDDSDDDGVEDGAENPGQITEFKDGLLTVKLFGGGTLSALVTADTEIKCDDGAGDAHASGVAHDGPGDDDGGDDQGDDGRGDAQGDDDQGDDHGDDGAARCGADALQVGAKVLEGDVHTSGEKAVWEEIEVQRP
jgi:hypothetical protein